MAVSGGFYPTFLDKTFHNMANQQIGIQRFYQEAAGPQAGGFLDDFGIAQSRKEKDPCPVQQVGGNLFDQVQAVLSRQVGID